MVRALHTKLILAAAALLCAAVLVGCGSEGGGTGGGTTAETTRGGPAPAVPEDAPLTTALSGAGEAERLAEGWNEDARLYAIASLAPRVDAEGRAPGWLYSYVSPSAGAVAMVSVVGEEAELTPEQELPEDQVEDISGNTLPPTDELIDSPEAMSRADDVRAVLEEEPAAEASAGVDSFSSQDPAWIFAAAAGDERVEERITASKP